MANNYSKHNGMLSKAKINLMTRKDSVFITTVLFSLRPKWDTTIPTGATNGVDLFLNPQFFENLDFAERVFLLAHETWHVIFKHMDRAKSRDPMKWNKACDYVINLLLKDSGFKLIQGALCDEKYRGMSAVDIYDMLPDEPGDPGGTGSDLAPPPPDMEKEDWENQVNSAIQRGAMEAEKTGAAGTIPGEVGRFLDKLSKPKVDWRKALRNQFTAMAKKDYSMSRPNRRFIGNDMYIPTLHGEAMGEIACAVDTSGSVSDKEFTAFVSEITKIKDEFNPEKLTALDFDTTIKKVYEVNQDQKLVMEFDGYGGTDMWPVFEFFKGRKQPKCLIVFSDMYCDMSMPRPPYPVIWVCVNRADWNHDWGKVIHYDTSDL
ncbi:HNH endonuclease [Vibrio phage D518]